MTALARPAPRSWPERLAPQLPWAAFGVALYLQLWPIMTSDVQLAYVPWLEHVAHLGPIRAFAAPFGDYAPPYLYLLALASPLVGVVPSDTLVKLVSLAGALLLSLAVRRLLRALDAPHPDRHAFYALLLPGVLMNTALMGQCDALYAAPTVMAVAAAVDGRHRAMFLWCGLAVAVKLQAVFIAPFFLALAIQRRLPLHWWLLAPAALVAAWAPAALAGWPVRDLALIYFRQTAYSETLSLNAPNIWAIVQALPVASSPISGAATMAALGASASYVWIFARRPLEGRALVAAAALAPMIVAGLLPHMHERYFFAADVLVFASAVASRRRADRVTAALVQGGSFLGIMAYGNGTAGLAMLGALLMLAATWRLARPLAAAPCSAKTMPLRAGA